MTSQPSITYDFSDLSEQQQIVLTYKGWRVTDKFQRRPSAVRMKKLIDRGLVIPREISIGGRCWTEYEVPLAVHIAWCEHCKREGKIV